MGALDLAGGQGEFLPGNQLFGAVGKGAQANFGTLGVQHGCHGQIQLLRQGAQQAVTTGVFLVIAVGEVKTGNVHTVFQQLTQNAGLIGRRTHSANNFRFTHKMYLLMHLKNTNFPHFIVYYKTHPQASGKAEQREFYGAFLAVLPGAAAQTQNFFNFRKKMREILAQRQKIRYNRGNRLIIRRISVMIQFLSATGTASTAEMIVSFLPIVILLVFMIVLVYLPQKRQDKKDAAMRNSIEIGDKVTTIGGIVGIVCAIADKDDTLVIETGSDRTKIRFRRSAISGVEKLDAGKDSKAAPVKK